MRLFYVIFVTTLKLQIIDLLGAHQKGCRRKHKTLQNDSNIVVDTNA